MMTEYRSNSQTLRYHNGVTLGVARRIAQFWFQDKFIQIKADSLKWTYVITVRDSTPEWQIKTYKDYWKIEILREAKPVM